MAHEFEAMIATMTYTQKFINETPPPFNCDNSEDFLATGTVEAARKFGARMKTTVSNNPLENGLFEWIKRKIMNAVRCALSTDNMPLKYWP